MKNDDVAPRYEGVVSSSWHGDAVASWCCATFVVVSVGDENRAAQRGCPIRGSTKYHKMDDHLFLGIKWGYYVGAY